ncbi:MAG: PDZ domain-containing protein [Pseudomonadota bacterium]
MNKKIRTVFLISTLSLSTLPLHMAVAENTAVTTDTSSSVSQLEQTPWLGVSIENVPITLARHLSPMLENNQGVFIRKVHLNSPAQTAQLIAYDVITQLDDQKIFSAKQLSQLIQNKKVSSTVEIHYIRHGKLQQQKIVLTAKPQIFQQQMPQTRHKQHAYHNQCNHKPFFNPQMKHHFPYGLNSQYQNDSQNNWSEFESIMIQSINKDKFQVKVKYQAKNGEVKEFTFKGDMQQIQQQINTAKDMDENKKQHLLQTLVSRKHKPQSHSFNTFPPSGWFNYSPFNQLPEFQKY